MDWRAPAGQSSLLHTSCAIEPVKDYLQFQRFKAMQAKAKADAKARELAAVDSRQQCLDIEATTVLQLPQRGRRGAA